MKVFLFFFQYFLNELGNVGCSVVAYISKDSYFSDSFVCVYEKAQKKTLRKIKTAKKNLMHTWCIDDNFGKLIPDIITNFTL